MSALREIKHKMCGRDASKAQGEAECFISIKPIASSALFRIKHEEGNVLTLLKHFQRNALI